jgi:regulatory protein YycH of two-component signal transduction system YycFG
MKISEKLIRFGLIIMVALSFYFSYMIWLNPTGYDRSVEQSTDTTNTTIQTYKQKSDLFLPLYLTWFYQDEIKETNSETLIRDVQGLLSDAEVGELTMQQYDEASFSQVAMFDDGITLAYYAPFLLNDYAETFGLDLTLADESASKSAFSLIEIDLKNNKIQFVNVNDLRILSGDINWNPKEVDRILEDNPREWTAMQQEETDSRQFYTENTIKLKKYSYVSSLQSANLFREAFFTSPKDVKVNDDSVDTYYYEGGQNMAVLHENQVVKFETTIFENDEVDMFMQSAEFVRRLGNNFGTIRFFDRTNNQLDYRIFVEGYPVFSSGPQGLLQVTFSKSGQSGNREMAIESSLNAIQVPIPSETEVELPSSLTVRNDLLSLGAQTDALQQIIVGYQWGDIKGASVVDLTPTWYVKYENQWYKYQDLMAKLTETGGV